ncbi:hypothetical protein [Pedobacter cryotolerans]|uniref:TolB-like protein n=1 Tax=Pedobacter cryotolerans TaxID=2571270 RepID=A0A4U1C8Z2_9SPHI|nr:hypothetical protein [Pedobacter cryotolerans]TKC00053.1 hypothetical protein FA045_11480 [Pedobacter cryotolerans]
MIKYRPLILILGITALIATLLYFSKKNDNSKYDFTRKIHNLTSVVDTIMIGYAPIKIEKYSNGLLLHDEDNYKIHTLDYSGQTNFLFYGSSIKDIVIGFKAIQNGIFLFKPRRKVIEFIDLNSGKVLNSYKREKLFTRAAILGDTIALVKENLDELGLNDVFTTFVLGSDRNLQLPNILKKRNDGGLQSDGFFVYGSDKVFYINYFLSSIYSFTPNGQLFMKGSTLDRNAIPPKVVSEREGSYSLKETVKTNNRSGSSDNGLLYINSSVKSKKDDISNRISVIDVYDCNSLQYKHSITVPDFEKNKLYDFTVNNNKLYALYGKKILIYQL